MNKKQLRILHIFFQNTTEISFCCQRCDLILFNKFYHYNDGNDKGGNCDLCANCFPRCYFEYTTAKTKNIEFKTYFNGHITTDYSKCGVCSNDLTSEIKINIISVCESTMEFTRISRGYCHYKIFVCEKCRPRKLKDVFHFVDNMTVVK